MSCIHQFKRSIVKQLAPLTNSQDQHLLSLLRVPKQQSDGQFFINIPKLLSTFGPDPKIDAAPEQWCQRACQQIAPTGSIQQVMAKGPNLHFYIKPTDMTKGVLQQVYEEKDRYGWADAQPVNQTVVLDYSSPNIAKPFHAGHLRSTILGNYIKRIHRAMGYTVKDINYLGDWGKQYGLLAVGFSKYGSEAHLERDPIHHLYEVYVKINKEAEADPEIHQRANAYFRQMERGNPEALAQWQRFRQLSIDSYASIYARLNISFHEYSGESQVDSYIPKVHAQLEAKGLLTHMDDGALAVDLSRFGLKPAIVQRADGTSLYLTRDLAAVLLRQDKYAFDKAIYVVGMEQQAYFRQVFACASLLTDRDPADFLHASFGRIQGMSTRQGTAVFLQDILDTAKDTILDYMATKDSLSADLLDPTSATSMDTIADQLGTSAILIQDMKAKRQKNYNFSWDRMTDTQGDTGVFLQYAHARACGIDRRVDIPVTLDGQHWDLLKERSAFELIQTISYFPDVVQQSFEALEPCTIVNYLFKLSHATSYASRHLRVLGSDPDVAKARMLLFWAARTTLHNGMSLLGMSPLDKM
ncbi:arginyl-tRNA synthetase [Hesseltinella vesiculosa]|uniref:arginine--tRNA ligase n=1 Tax=Hesseltinella vesiculosa TaxID=101127 RepID=A0A1X2GP79_9FUNG|nr:arginyl-tRNA synthetase [Hesseltinella vesiculosa]